MCAGNNKCNIIKRDAKRSKSQGCIFIYIVYIHLGSW